MTTVSVVMSVYDEPGHVKKTIESVLKQEGVDFEFIIVSDGASDAVVDVVNLYLDDERVRFIKQVNQGLTVALINGCSQASSPFIARIDAGDVMLSDRLKRQSDVLQRDTSIGIVSSWVSIETEEGYFLYDLVLTDTELNKAVYSLSVDDFRSPFHASVMFRKSAYFDVGGYRASFYFAQDCDLWSRMIDHSKIVMIESVLTKGIFSAQGISGKYADEQKKLLALILQARGERNNGKSDDDTLIEAAKLRPSKIKKVVKVPADNFNGLYFVAKILMDNKSKYALTYWHQVLRCRPLSMKSWFFMMKSLLNLILLRNKA